MAEAERACTGCGKPAVTRDGRDLCLKCLRKAVAKDTPMVGCWVGCHRGPNHAQAADREPSPWAENAVREMEDAP